MTAGAGATGVRAWLARHGGAWLTARRLRAVTVALLAAALLGSAVGVSGSTASSQRGGQPGTAAAARR